MVASQALCGRGAELLTRPQTQPRAAQLSLSLLSFPNRSFFGPRAWGEKLEVFSQLWPRRRAMHDNQGAIDASHSDAEIYEDYEDKSEPDEDGTCSDQPSADGSSKTGQPTTLQDQADDSQQGTSAFGAIGNAKGNGRHSSARDASSEAASLDGSNAATNRGGATGAAVLGAAAIGTAGVVKVARQIKPKPVLLVHGILDCAENMQAAANYLRAALGPGTYVRAVDVGNGYVDSLTKPMAWQLASLTATIQADLHLANGFNMIGYSQGSLLARGYVQKHNKPKVDTLISWVGPQAGQFGVPAWEELLAYLNKITSPMWYTPPIQATVSFSNYWRDPMHMPLYLSRSAFLADINNERSEKNLTYASNLGALDRFVLIASTVDKIIVPRESSWFAFYAPNSTSTIVPMRESPLYTEDWIGLKQLDTTGRLHFASCVCHHREVPTSACKLQVWDRVSVRFLQPQGALPTLLRWLLPEAGPEQGVDQRSKPGAPADGKPAEQRPGLPSEIGEKIMEKISDAARAARSIAPDLMDPLGPKRQRSTFPKEAPVPD